jgi:L-alanine-DL-glutamate epimerase-like enolase superfamily enzyme
MLSATLVRVETDEGTSGIGECLTRFAFEAAAAVVEKILTPGSG